MYYLIVLNFALPKCLGMQKSDQYLIYYIYTHADDAQ
jgi:hypothetical protein